MWAVHAVPRSGMEAIPLIGRGGRASVLNFGLGELS
eukprot:CAMPEP_0202868208 /NCGR_PEP_ID=MMETSP1391-20130828/10459_1 /ASSEMBLY_ACC=CAM_ASM_000867 /TAXON_ID=1034604 /ORGANISM="Chlamydomonas leiostraca, Strain SAG 11-49" /LENGTH=35 /DNA_ID= /DNA_START= /DNA_END= /DNA_ORIENTATION=